jgi:hypothetical protein
MPAAAGYALHSDRPCRSTPRRAAALSASGFAAEQHLLRVATIMLTHRGQEIGEVLKAMGTTMG